LSRTSDTVVNDEERPRIATDGLVVDDDPSVCKKLSNIFDLWALAGRGVLPFIFITALTDETICAQALKAEAICFLTKPSMLELIRCISIALEESGAKPVRDSIWVLVRTSHARSVSGFGRWKSGAKRPVHTMAEPI
jgi:hypothetical protein